MARKKTSRKEAKQRQPTFYLEMVGKIAITLLVVVTLIAVGASLFLSDEEEEDVELDDLRVHQVTGDSLEERLSKHIDIQNAKITRITDVEALKRQYSGVFEDAENGHYIVEVTGRLLIYDYERDLIIHDFQYREISIN